MMRTVSSQITKSENDIRYCKDQKTAQRSDEQNSTADRMNNKGKIFWDWRESLFKSKQHSCKVKKQEVEQQEYKTVWD